MQQLITKALVSPVGQQPGAVATVAKTLYHSAGVREFVLLPTNRTQAEAERLCHFLKTLGHDVTVNIPISDAGQEYQAVNAIERFCEDFNGQVYFNCAAGLGFRIAKFSFLLQGVEQLTPVFAEFHELLDLHTKKSYPLHDIGLDQLLDLHDLGGTWNSGGTGPVRDLRLTNEEEIEVFRADEAYEARGKLHCLSTGTNDGVSATRLQAARWLIALRKERSKLNGLTPEITAVTQYWHVRSRLRVAGLSVIYLHPADQNGAARKLDRWRTGDPIEPGTQAPENIDIPRECKGAGGDGPPLIVCIGNDPGSTLVAIFSHRPKHLWLLYDQTTSYVRTMAGRMAQLAKLLPVDKMFFEPTDVLGKDIGEKLVDEVKKQCQNGQEIMVNVSPGSKAQSWMLGRLVDVTLCSNRTQPPSIVWLTDGQPLEDVRYTHPSILVLTQARAGRLLDEGRDQKYLKSRDDFLKAVSQHVSDFARQDTNGGFFLQGIGKKDWVMKPNHRDHWALRWQVTQVRVEARVGQAIESDYFEMPAGSVSGQWLEVLVAYWFMQAGGDDSRIGMRWPHRIADALGATEDAHHRTEIDVAFRWREQMVAVSVKARPLNQNEQLPLARTEIIAVANECFGRFCLPVLVKFVPARYDTQERALEILDEEGVLEIGITHLMDSQWISDLFDEAFKTRRTT